MARSSACKVSFIRWHAVTAISTVKTVLLAMRFSAVATREFLNVRPL
jgi:hypothetical protein